jgi:hypothetical protein
MSNIDVYYRGIGKKTFPDGYTDIDGKGKII